MGGGGLAAVATVSGATTAAIFLRLGLLYAGIWRFKRSCLTLL